VPTTPKIALELIADENELVDFTKINGWLSQIDTQIGLASTTSGARPASPWSGQIAYESDTGAKIHWAGATWLYMGQGTETYGTSGANAPHVWRSIPAPAGNRALDLRRSTDVNQRFSIDFDGRLKWGDGTAAADVNLYRDSATTLRSDQILQGSAIVGASGRRQDPPLRYRTTSFTTTGGTTAATFQISTLAIPDPGFPYFINVSAAIEIQAASNTQPKLVVRQGTATGTIAAEVMGVDGQYRHAVTPFGFVPKTGSLTGATTLYMMLERAYGTGNMQAITSTIGAMFEAHVHPA
jgi:hypothetical protein